MIKYKVLFGLLLLLLTRYKLLAQDTVSKRYVIVSIEESHNKGFEGTHTYYWITEADAMERTGEKNKIFSPLLFSVSGKKYDDCCKGVSIDPLLLTPADSVFELGAAYYKEKDQLKSLIHSKRKEVQRITKQWPVYNSRQVIKFYITPVKGRFCSSTLAKTFELMHGYAGKVYLPYASFEPDELSTAQMKVLSSWEFTGFTYDLIPWFQL